MFNIFVTSKKKYITYVTKSQKKIMLLNLKIQGKGEGNPLKASLYKTPSALNNFLSNEHKKIEIKNNFQRKNSALRR